MATKRVTPTMFTARVGRPAEDGTVRVLATVSDSSSMTRKRAKWVDHEMAVG